MQAGMWLASQVCKHSSFHSSVWHGWCVTQICSSCLPKNCTQCELEFHPTVWDEVVLSTVEHEFHTCWGLDTSLEYEHQIPPETGDTNLASQCFYHSVGPEYLWTPVIIQYSVVMTGVNTLGITAVHPWKTKKTKAFYCKPNSPIFIQHFILCFKHFSSIRTGGCTA